MKLCQSSKRGLDNKNFKGENGSRPTITGSNGNIFSAVNKYLHIINSKHIPTICTVVQEIGDVRLWD